VTRMRFPGYEVLAKFHGVSWNDASRRTISDRLATSRRPRFFTDEQWPTLLALCDRILPQPADRAPVPIAALLDARLFSGRTDGFRRANMPEQNEAWRRGLAALDAEAQAAQASWFHRLARAQQEELLRQMQQGKLKHPAWGDMPSKGFFEHRVLRDLAAAYYAHPTAWSEMGFGGPASPRGYVRMDFDRRDPWEAAEAQPGRDLQALQENLDVA
jgi:Gluconate 2-dehydrogenase subunit 3